MVERIRTFVSSQTPPEIAMGPVTAPPPTHTHTDAFGSIYHAIRFNPSPWVPPQPPGSPSPHPQLVYNDKKTGTGAFLIWVQLSSHADSVADGPNPYPMEALTPPLFTTPFRALQPPGFW